MNGEEPIFDFFISYSSHDKSWVRCLFAALVDSGYKVFFDEECIKAGDNIWLAISDALDSSRYLIFVVSQRGIASDWVQMEVIGQRWRDPLNRERAIIPVLVTDCTLPKLLQPIKYVDARGDRLLLEVVRQIELSAGSGGMPTMVGERTWLQGEAAAPPLDRATRIRDSLRLRLRFDFFTSGPMRGQFGPAGGRLEDLRYKAPGRETLYQSSSGEALKVKPAYFLTYWGWRAALRLLPDMVASYAGVTADFIRARFAGRRWMEVGL